MSGVSRVSIPSSVRKTIQNIKEIAKNHSDEEIYAMLKECSMDPNETVQKLLYQDTFHEVKRKRDKRKESNMDAADTKWRPGLHGRGVRGGRGNYTSRYVSRDFGAGRNIGSGKENGIIQFRNKDTASSSSHTPLVTETEVAVIENGPAASTSSLPSGPNKAEHLSADEPSSSGGGTSAEEKPAVEINKIGIHSDQGKSSLSDTIQCLSSSSISSSPGVYASAVDPVLIRSLEGRIPGLVGTIRRGAANHRFAAETDADTVSQDAGGSEFSILNEIGASEKNSSCGNGKVHGSSLKCDENQVSDSFQAAPSASIVGSSGSRPSSNYSNRAQHASGHLKAVPVKEWKPKSTNVSPVPTSEVVSTSTDEREAISSSSVVSDFMVCDDNVKMKLEDLRISDNQYVIIPEHLQVPECERSGLTFGSFGSNFGLTIMAKRETDIDEIPEEPLKSPGKYEGNVDELPSSNRNSAPVVEDDSYAENQQHEFPENSSTRVSHSPSLSETAAYDQTKAEVSVPIEESQGIVVHTPPSYSNLSLVPPVLGSHFATFEGADVQARDNTRLPSFVIPQTFDPSANYYASIYRPTDGDGRFSPFLNPTAVPKYGGNIAVLPSQTGQSPQEGGNSLVLSSTGSSPLVTQAGVMQTSLPVSQQPVPVFRQPAGVHISPYPPNYVPYSQYYSPFYVPHPAAIHHFLGNAAMYPQQPPSGNIYPPQTVTAGVNSVKYPISQYKPASNSGPIGQGTYSLNPAGYSSVSVGNSSGSEDLSSQFKENNVFLTGQQSEGSAVWISPNARDISSLQTSSFYNVPPQGQPLAFAPTQSGHPAAAFTGLYHPSQSVAAGSVHPLLQQSQAMTGASEIAGPPPGVYQQPQRGSQINWVNNY
ncbi:hypothetical protein AXF42_Ash013727 [Apostasia shenzhenica]|uniref:GBF-interacting protein 1 N-terminal domain-containing protein n=1 Tax=Apostasia shenzhenica TaxID=1088818 RepID=A0A2I0A4P7_9ASPA|nr:hypothetical protein AXF42_Ash013727 [Apostasia shenzhenica]